LLVYYILYYSKCKVQPIAGHEGTEREQIIALLFLQPRRYLGVDGQRQTPAALTPRKTRYPLYRRQGWP